MSFDKRVVSCTYHCSIIQNSFSALNKPSVLHLFNSPHPQCMAPTEPFTSAAALSFSECHIIGITGYRVVCFFQTVFVCLAVSIQGSSMSLCTFVFVIEDYSVVCMHRSFFFLESIEGSLDYSTYQSIAVRMKILYLGE